MDGKKNNNNEYALGYGQAKADIVIRINEAFKLIHNELNGYDTFEFEIDAKDKQMLLSRQAALQWVRSMVKSVKCSKGNKE